MKSFDNYNCHQIPKLVILARIGDPTKTGSSDHTHSYYCNGALLPRLQWPYLLIYQNCENAYIIWVCKTLCKCNTFSDVCTVAFLKYFHFTPRFNTLQHTDSVDGELIDFFDFSLLQFFRWGECKPTASTYMCHSPYSYQYVTVTPSVTVTLCVSCMIALSFYFFLYHTWII